MHEWRVAGVHRQQRVARPIREIQRDRPAVPRSIEFQIGRRPDTAAYPVARRRIPQRGVHLPQSGDHVAGAEDVLDQGARGALRMGQEIGQCDPGRVEDAGERPLQARQVALDVVEAHHVGQRIHEALAPVQRGHAMLRAGHRIEEVADEVGPGGEARHPPRARRGPVARVVVLEYELFNLQLDFIGEFKAVAREELYAVVLVGVMRGRYDDPGVGPHARRYERYAGRGQRPHHERVHAHRAYPGHHGALEHVAGKARVLAYDYPVPARLFLEDVGD